MKNKIMILLLLLLTSGVVFAQQPYSGGIEIATGFKISDPQPIDDRTVVATEADLLTLPNKYNGLVVYVQATKTLHSYDGTDWTAIGGGGTSGDYIPLTGTEVGKPLTGAIEVDHTSSEFVGFVSGVSGARQKVGISDDGFAVLEVDDGGSVGSFLEVTVDGVYLQNYKYDVFNSSISSDFSGTKLRYNEQDGYNNTAEVIVGTNGTTTFNSTIPGDGFDGFMFYNYEDGLNLKDKVTTDNSAKLNFEGISGENEGLKWSILKDRRDRYESKLLFPDSGTTARRIPVSVNGIFADNLGNIEVEAGGSQNLLQTLDNGNIADDTGEVGEVILFYNPVTTKNSAIYNRSGVFGLHATVPGGTLEFTSSDNRWLVKGEGIGEFQGITGDDYYGANYTDNTYVQKKYVDDNFIESPEGGTDGQVLSTRGDGSVSWVTVSGGTSIHNDLTGIQGGTATERYHFTQDQHTKLLALIYSEMTATISTSPANGERGKSTPVSVVYNIKSNDDVITTATINNGIGSVLSDVNGGTKTVANGSKVATTAYTLSYNYTRNGTPASGTKTGTYTTYIPQYLGTSATADFTSSDYTLLGTELSKQLQSSSAMTMVMNPSSEYIWFVTTSATAKVYDGNNFNMTVGTWGDAGSEFWRKPLTLTLADGTTTGTVYLIRSQNTKSFTGLTYYTTN